MPSTQEMIEAGVSTSVPVEGGEVAATPAKESAPASAAPGGTKGLGQGGLLPEAALRKLRAQQQEFARTLGARLSISFRLDFSVTLAGLQTISFQKFVERAGMPLHFTLFRLDPLRGIGLLEIPPPLGLNIVDCLMGGAGKVDNTARALTEIESALLDQVSDVVLGEWCLPWTSVQELKPALAGHEIDVRFLNAISRETLILELSFEVVMGESKERFRLGLPYTSMEPLIRRFAGDDDVKEPSPAAATVAAMRWNPQLDDIAVPLTVTCSGLELTVQSLAGLKVGDHVPVDPEQFTDARIQVNGVTKFAGMLGTSEGRWAVQVTRILEA
jgi:flagellar motor switch protein FliM